MSGFCQFCQLWHSTSCCHPGRGQLDLVEHENTQLKAKQAEMREDYERLVIVNTYLTEAALTEAALELKTERDKLREALELACIPCTSRIREALKGDRRRRIE